MNLPKVAKEVLEHAKETRREWEAKDYGSKREGLSFLNACRPNPPLETGWLIPGYQREILENNISRPSGLVVSDADCSVVGPRFESQRRHGYL
ncbi:hypothetical protein TNCV_4542511 [Trichonephila clavipes]|nr:hypothetical protein TNCV_4542511 [Trichonephila clavipes]